MKHIINSFVALLTISLLASSCSHKTASTSTAKPISIDASKPHFTIAAADLAAPAKVSTQAVGNGRDVAISIHLKFSPAKADEFRKFTREHIQQQTQLLVGLTVVAEPIIMSEISDGQADLGFHSIDQAQSVADALNKR